MKPILYLLPLVLWPVMALADCPAICPTTCYYADSVNGNNANAGTSTDVPWKSLFKVNAGPGGGYLASAYVCLKRGSTWIGHLRFTGNGRATANAITTADGVAGAPFIVDAYGVGPAPIIQSESTVTGWSCVANICSATVTGDVTPFRVDAVKFGSMWGTCKGMNVALYCITTGGTAALAVNRDWNYSSGTLAVFDNLGTNPTVDFGAVVAVTDGAIQLLDIDGVNYVQVQHLQLLNQSWYGLEYRGTADHLTVANVYADTEVPFNYHAIGFYVHPEAATDLNLYNTDSHRGYNGYDFACGSSQCLTAAVVRNCKGYFNRGPAVLDETQTTWFPVTSVQVNGSNVLTVTAANTFQVGAVVSFSSLGTATFLNGVNVTVLTASSTQFTASFTHASYGPTAETVGNAHLANPPPGAVVSYDYCHFYGNSIKSPSPLEVTGGIAGTHNLAANTDPKVQQFLNYVPRFTLTFQPVGASIGADTALNNYIPALGATPISVGVATNFPATQGLISTIQGWITNNGYDINALGLSNVSYANVNTLTIQYTGTGSAATVTISGNVLSTSVTGGPGGENVSYDLTNASYNTVQKVELALRAGPYTATLPQPCSACSWLAAAAMLSKDLQSVSGQDIKTLPYIIPTNVANFMADETSQSKTWLTGNLTGLSSTFVYLYPGTLFDPNANASLEGYVTAGGFQGARGSISMTQSRDALVGAFDTVAANGIDVQGLIAYSLAGWASLTPTQLAQTIQAAVEKSSVWGVPFLLYWQPGYLSNTQLTNIVNDLAASGVTLTTNASLVSTITGKTQYSGTNAYAWAPDAGGSGLNLLPSYQSPTINSGLNLGAAYSSDLNGIPQASWRPRWDLGAQQYVPIFIGGLQCCHNPD